MTRNLPAVAIAMVVGVTAGACREDTPSAPTPAPNNDYGIDDEDWDRARQKAEKNLEKAIEEADEVYDKAMCRNNPYNDPQEDC
jgi:hypothetical protein